MRKCIVVIVFILIFRFSFATIPQGYYTTFNGKQSGAYKTELHNISTCKFRAVTTLTVQERTTLGDARLTVFNSSTSICAFFTFVYSKKFSYLWKLYYFCSQFMSNLQNKSEVYLDSAKLLNKNYYYSPVAHCAYYACYQLIKHIWLHKIGKSDEELEALCKEKKREGSHEVLINQIGSYIKNSSNKNKIDDFRVFNNNLVALKKLRVKADYKDVNFDSIDSSNAISLSDSVIPLLKKYQ